MATRIKIQRSQTVRQPTDLQFGELAFTTNGSIFWVGQDQSNTANVLAIGGARHPGVLTANQAIVVNGNSTVDHLRTNRLTVGDDGSTVNVQSISYTANSSQLGETSSGSNTELVPSWAIRTFVEGYVEENSPVVGGSDTHVQYNANGDLGGSAGFTFNPVTNSMALANALTVGGTLTVPSIGGTLVNVAANVVLQANLNQTGATFNVGAINFYHTGTTARFDSNVNFTADVTVGGDLVINGNVVTINAATVSTKDVMIELGVENTGTDTVDLGFYGNFGNSLVTQYAGMFRDSSNGGIFTLFSSNSEPTATVNTSHAGFALGTLLGYFTGPYMTANASGLYSSNAQITGGSITGITDLAVGDGGTGRSTITAGGVPYGNGANPLGFTAAGAEGKVLQANASGLPEFLDVDGGSY